MDVSVFTLLAFVDESFVTVSLVYFTDPGYTAWTKQSAAELHQPEDLTVSIPALGVVRAELFYKGGFIRDNPAQTQDPKGTLPKYVWLPREDIPTSGHVDVVVHYRNESFPFRL